LSLCNNSINQLSSEIVKMENLETLALNDNQLSTLPKELADLKKLTHLFIRNNLFTKEEKIRIKTMLPNVQITFQSPAEE
jgi:leucine-rich repeat protein SHOC2